MVLLLLLLLFLTRRCALNQLHTMALNRPDLVVDATRDQLLVVHRGHLLLEPLLDTFPCRLLLAWRERRRVLVTHQVRVSLVARLDAVLQGRAYVDTMVVHMDHFFKGELVLVVLLLGGGVEVHGVADHVGQAAGLHHNCSLRLVVLLDTVRLDQLLIASCSFGAAFELLSWRVQTQVVALLLTRSAHEAVEGEIVRLAVVGG